MKDVYNILLDIKNTTSSKKKEEIIRNSYYDGSDYENLIDTFKLALDCRIRFDVIIDTEEIMQGNGRFVFDISLENFFLYLHRCPSHRTEARKQHLKNMLFHLEPNDRYVACCVVNKDLNIGVNAKTVNKAIKDHPTDVHIYHFEPMKGYKEKEHPIVNVNYPAVAQTKIDAARAFLVYDEHGVRILSSTGREVSGLDHIEKPVHDMINANETDDCFTIDGEMVLMDEEFEQFEERKKSNGVFNKAIKGTISEDEAKRFVFVVWDHIPEGEECLFDGYYDEPYFVENSEVCRLGVLESFVQCLKSFYYGNFPFQIVKTKIVYSASEAQNFADDLIANGEEGAIIKEMDIPYEPKRSKKMVKAKKAYNADVRITGVNEGKNKGTLGSISYSTDDEMVKGDVSGIPDHLKELWWDNPDEIVGKIVELRYMEISVDKRRSDGVMTLYGPPSIMNIRDDKDETDTIEKLL